MTRLRLRLKLSLELGDEPPEEEGCEVLELGAETALEEEEPEEEPRPRIGFRP